MDDDDVSCAASAEAAVSDASCPAAAPAASEAWHAGACAAAEEAFELLLACEQPADYWRHAGYEQGVAVQTLVYGHPAWAERSSWVEYGYSLFRASDRFEHESPGDIFDILHDWDARAGTPDKPGWDSSIEVLRVAQPIPHPERHYAVAQHLSKPAMRGLVGPREFVFVFATRRERLGTADELHCSVCRSEPGATAAVVPTPTVGYTRGDLFLGGVTLRHDPEGGARMTLLTCAAPRGSIPRAAVNLGGVKGAALLADLRRHLDKRRASASASS